MYNNWWVEHSLPSPDNGPIFCLYVTSTVHVGHVMLRMPSNCPIVTTRLAAPLAKNALHSPSCDVKRDWDRIYYELVPTDSNTLYIGVFHSRPNNLYLKPYNPRNQKHHR